MTPTVTAEHRLPCHWISGESDLRNACSALASASALAIDTEFERTRTFHARFALFQISDGKDIYLIDPIALGILEPLWRILTDAGIRKYLHSGSEDMELLGQQMRQPAANLLDTQIAAGLIGSAPTLSYQNLVAEYCEIEIDKGETRSDWMQRPLTESQKRYAALDVWHLFDAAELLERRLKEIDRLDAALEDSNRMMRSAMAETRAEDLLNKMRHAWKLEPHAQCALYQLLDWRERHARNRDIPRRRVMADDALIDIATRRPDDADDIRKLGQMSKGKAAAVANDIQAALQTAENAFESDKIPAVQQPLTPRQRKLLKALKAEVESAAESMKVDSQVIASKKDLLGLLHTGELPEKLSGWRRPVVGEKLMELYEADLE